MWFVHILWVWIACGCVGGIFNVRCNCTLTQQQYEHLKRVSKLIFWEKSFAAVGIWTHISSAPGPAFKWLSHIHKFSIILNRIQDQSVILCQNPFKKLKNLLCSCNFLADFVQQGPDLWSPLCCVYLLSAKPEACLPERLQAVLAVTPGRCDRVDQACKTVGERTRAAWIPPNVQWVSRTCINFLYIFYFFISNLGHRLFSLLPVKSHINVYYSQHCSF